MRCSLVRAAKKKQFQMMRKMHYNEAMNIKLARQLIANELEEDEDADEEMRDDTEEMEEISVDPPQDGEERRRAQGRTRGTVCFLSCPLLGRSFVFTPDKNVAEVQGVRNNVRAPVLAVAVSVCKVKKLVATLCCSAAGVGNLFATS